MYRSAVGQTCPPETHRGVYKDPCSYTYLVDLPLIGEEEVEVPVEQLSMDFMNSVVRRLPYHLPQIFTDVRPYVEELKQETIDDAEALFQRTLDQTLRPEIAAQKAQLISDINREVNKHLVTFGLITVTLVGAVGLSAWYIKKRVRK